MRKPDFFIVGAPKCGTTALDSYLKVHPHIYMARKELHFFGSDLAFSPRRRGVTEDEYLKQFRRAPATARRLGEASVSYLYSENAPSEIEAFSPGAKIIIMLRNPVDMIYSLHSQLLYGGDETISDFQEALDAEPGRRRGLNIPAKTLYPPGLLYRDVGRYVHRVEHYLSFFGRDRVQIIVFDDFKSDTAATYAETLRFLGVADDFAPNFRVVNGNKRARNRTIQNVLTGRSASFVNRWAKTVLPAKLRRRTSDALMQINARESRRPSMHPELRRRLDLEFTPEVERLSMLLDRDLTYWTRSEHRTAGKMEVPPA